MKRANSVRKVVGSDFDSAVTAVEGGLHAGGFHILSQHDLQAMLWPKSRRRRRYRLIHACQPELLQALSAADAEIPLIAPCSIAVYETPEREVVVAAADAMVVLSGHTRSTQDAQEWHDRLTRVVLAVR